MCCPFYCRSSFLSPAESAQFDWMLMSRWFSPFPSFEGICLAAETIPAGGVARLGHSHRSVLPATIQFVKIFLRWNKYLVSIMEVLTARICRLQKVGRRGVLDTPFLHISRYILPRGIDIYIPTVGVPANSFHSGKGTAS